MKIALLGGTGDIGTGFAVRWAANHEIIIGSRKADKAKEAATAVMQTLEGKGNVRGTDNGSAVAAADVVVLCVPYEHLVSVTSDLLASYSNQLVISPVVPMSYNGKFFPVRAAKGRQRSHADSLASSRGNKDRFGFSHHLRRRPASQGPRAEGGCIFVHR